LKGFLKTFTDIEAIGKIISNIVLLFFMVMAWYCVGLIVFALLFQWVFLLFFQGQNEFVLQVFMIAWTIFGVWIWFRVDKN
jgi:hypothetical protein